MTLVVLPSLPPVVSQTISRTPLSVWSALAFAAVAVCASVVARYRPPWALGLLFGWTPFAFYRDIGATTITVSKALLVGTLIGLLAGGVGRPRSAAGLNRSVVTFWVAAFAVLVTTILSAVRAEYLGPVGREALKLVEYIALGWGAFVIVRAHGDRANDALAIGALIALFLVSAYAAAQSIFGGAPSALNVANQRVPRVAGPLEGPNQLAGYLEAVLPVVWLSPLLRTPRFVIARFAATALGVAALMLSQSRAGIAIVIFAYVALWWIDRPAARSVLGSMIVGLASGVAIVLHWFALATNQALWAWLNSIFGPRLPEAPGGVGTRGELWRAAIALFKRSPLTGIGAGNFELSLRSVGLPGVRTHANSLWLQTLAEQGALGLAALVAFAGASLRAALTGIRASWVARAAVLATVALFAHQLVDDLFFFPKIGMTWWLLIGAAVGAAAG